MATKTVQALMGFLDPDLVERTPGEKFEMDEAKVAEFVFNGRITDKPAKETKAPAK